MDRINAILATFIAVTAIPVGLALALGLQELALVWLEGTPFDSYRVPGLLLAAAGATALVAAVLGFLRHPSAGWAAAVAGAAMTAYVVAQLLLLNDGEPQPYWIEWMYLALGLLLLGLGLASALGLGTRYVVVYRAEESDGPRPVDDRAESGYSDIDVH